MALIYFIAMVVFAIPFIFWGWFNHSKTTELFGMTKWKFIPMVFGICLLICVALILLAVGVSM